MWSRYGIVGILDFDAVQSRIVLIMDSYLWTQHRISNNIMLDSVINELTLLSMDIAVPYRTCLKITAPCAIGGIINVSTISDDRHPQ